MRNVGPALPDAKKTGKLPPYRYLDTEPDRCQFRLLESDPDYSPGDAQASRFSFRLQAFDVAKAPDFIALSSTWGSPTDQKCSLEPEQRHKILVDGIELEVRTNLYHALGCIWRRCGLNQRFLFWIDAFCIDQNDSEEKGNQVRLMGLIYSRASKVWVWLGPSEGVRVDRAEELIKNLAKAYHDMQKHVESSKLSNVDLDWKAATLDGRILRRHNVPTSFRSQSWQALASLLERQWWSRMWIIQEISLAKDADVLIGDHVLSWSDVCHCSAFLSMGLDLSLAGQLQEKDNAEDRLSRVGTGLLTLNGIRSLVDDPGGIYRDLIFYLTGTPRLDSLAGGLAVLLHLSCEWQASDPRDQVYALLGLVARIVPKEVVLKDMDGFIVPEYGTSEEQEMIEKARCDVFSLAAKSVIRSTKWLGYLTLVENARDHAQVQMPSWVPDLTKVPSPRVGIKKGLAYRLLSLRDMSQKASPMGLPRVVGSALHCSGSKIGVVSGTSESLQDFCDGLCIFERGAALVPNGKKRYALTRDSYEDAFGKTLIGSESTEEPVCTSFKRFWWRKHVIFGLQSGLAADEYLKTMPAILKFSPGLAENIHETIGNPRKLNHLSEKFKGDAAYQSDDFETLFRRVCPSRRMFRTDRNHLGIGHASIQKGDEVWFLARAPTPFVLRRVDKRPNVFTLVGHAYLHGFFELLEKIEIEYWPIEII